MENKKGKLILMIIAIVIVIALILTVFFDVFKIDTKTKKEETETKEETKEFSYMPLTYKVCDEDSCVYITGSIHLGDKRITKIDEKLMKIFEECDYLALEVHDDTELDTSSFMLKNGQTIKDLVSPDLYAKMEKFEEDHPMFILKTLNNFTPAYMYDYIDLLPYIENKYTREGVDSFFESKAENANKENQYRILSFPWCIAGKLLSTIKLGRIYVPKSIKSKHYNGKEIIKKFEKKETKDDNNKKILNKKTKRNKNDKSAKQKK